MIKKNFNYRHIKRNANGKSRLDDLKNFQEGKLNLQEG